MRLTKSDVILEENGVHVVADIIANSGGVIVSYFEWVQDMEHLFWSLDEVNSRLNTLIIRSLSDIKDTATRYKTTLRTGALALAVERISDSLNIRGFFP